MIDARDAIAALPRLGSPVETVPCKICRAPSQPFDVVDFNKSCDFALYPHGFSGIAVPYYRCQACGFLFATFFDDWTAEDFARLVYNDDYVIVDPEYVGSRAVRTARDVAPLLAARGKDRRILDYGSGSGAFAAELNVLGFTRVESYDPFATQSRPRGRFDIVTCFEVIEHVVQPREALSDIAGLLTPNGDILIGTSFQPENIIETRCNWWYVAPRNGHVSIFTPDAMRCLASPCGLRVRAIDGTLTWMRRAKSSFCHRIFGPRR